MKVTSRELKIEHFIDFYANLNHTFNDMKLISIKYKAIRTSYFIRRRISSATFSLDISVFNKYSRYQDQNGRQGVCSQEAQSVRGSCQDNWDQEGAKGDILVLFLFLNALSPGDQDSSNEEAVCLYQGEGSGGDSSLISYSICNIILTCIHLRILRTSFSSRLTRPCSLSSEIQSSIVSACQSRSRTISPRTEEIWRIWCKHISFSFEYRICKCALFIQG